MINKQNDNKIWWKEKVIYQIYPKSFNDSNGDGIGDLNGIKDKLGYFEKLGITAIWICPIFKSPMVDNGYDISDYQELNPKFGSMEDLDELIKEADKLNIKIILDLVVNHTSDEHTWFQKALNEPNSKYRDYYIFKKSTGNQPPNNWRSIFGGSVWEEVDGEDGTYYFHSFDKKQPDLNWENPELRQEIYTMINWWLDKGISGFRVDSITFIKKDSDYASLEPDGSDGLVSVKEKGRNRPGIEDFLFELQRETFDKYDCVTIGEAPGVPYSQYDDFIGNKGYFDMIFDFNYVDIDVESGSEWYRRTDWTISELKEKIFKSQDTIKDIGWSVNFLENHDQPRSISKLIRDEAYQNDIGAKALAVLFFFLRGTPIIYQGQELGMKNFERKSIEEFDDISSIDNYYRSIQEGFTKEDALRFVNLRSRDNTRTPFHWDSGEYAGFSSNEPWLNMNKQSLDTNVEDQIDDSTSVLNFYRQMVALRNNSEYRETLIYGDIKPIDSAENIVAYERVGKEKIDIYINFSDKETNINNIGGKMLLNNYTKSDLNDSNLILKPYQSIVILRSDPNG